MNKVITINLNGHAYQVEEQGYDALTRYLDSARAALAEDPDRDEIMLDFEQAIADKCDAKLGARKNVVSNVEVDEILAAMGPVEGAKAKDEKGAEGEAAADGATAGATKEPHAVPKRLYRIPAGEWFFGVCTGLAAYFNLDITLMRLIFVVLGVLTHGAWLAVYVILIFVMPVARTEDDLAAARGEAPVTANDLLNRARAQYRDEIKPRVEGWRSTLHEEHAKHKAWKEAERARKRAMRQAWRAERRNGRNPGLVVFGGIMLAAVTTVWAVSVWTFMANGTILGLTAHAGQPMWLTLLWLTIAYFLISWPFKAMMHARGGGPFAFILSIVIIGLAFYLASLVFPDVHTWWHAMTAYLQTTR